MIVEKWTETGWTSGTVFVQGTLKGVKEFMRVAAQHAGSGSRVLCPCKRCNNCHVLQLSAVLRHLFLHGIVERYNPWVHRGERFQLVDHNLTAGQFQVKMAT